MAKAPWLKTSPASGSGNGTSDFSSNAPHTGRVVRITSATFKAAGVSDVVRNVSQAGKPEYADIQDAATAPKAGGTVTIEGTTNSKNLSFSLGAGDLDITLPNTYNANSVQVNNGADIPGDPGASVEIPFSIVITVDANTGVDPLTRQIIVTDEGGHQDVCTLTLAAGDPTLSVDHESGIELDWEGTPVTVTVTSNTNWTVE